MLALIHAKATPQPSVGDICPRHTLLLANGAQGGMRPQQLQAERQEGVMVPALGEYLDLGWVLLDLAWRAEGE